MHKNQEKKNERHTGFELLRIISMIMIVCMHIIGHGGLGTSPNNSPISYYMYWLIYALSRVSTNCFIMLTGYYMVSSNVRFSRIFRMDCQVIFYSILTYFIAVAVGAVQISASELIKVFTPVTSGGYWFVTGYVLLYFCIPLLNRAIAGIENRAVYRRILLVMLLLSSVWTTLFYWTDSIFINGGYSYIWFIVLYFLAAYIRIYDVKLDRKLCLGIYFGLALIVPFTRIAAEWIQEKIHATTFVDNIMDYKMPITVVMSILFFLFFKNVEIQNRTMKKMILKIAPFSFGVYLLHDSDYIRGWLWKIVGADQFAGNISSVGYMILIVLVIVCAGCIVDYIYQRLYQIFIFGKIEKWIDEKCKL